LTAMNVRMATADRGSSVAPTAFSPASAALTAQEYDVVHHYFCRISFLAVLIVPGASAEAAFEVNLFALGQVLNQVIVAPKDDPVPVRLILPFAGLAVLPAAVRRQGELRNRDARGSIPGLGVAAEVTNQNDFVDATACHISEAYHKVRVGLR